MSRPFGVALLMAGFDDRGAQVRQHSRFVSVFFLFLSRKIMRASGAFCRSRVCWNTSLPQPIDVAARRSSARACDCCHGAMLCDQFGVCYRSMQQVYFLAVRGTRVKIGQ